MKKGGGFGAPKPLAGQTGYKMTESDILEKEAKEMEERLKLLNSRMQNQDSSALMSSSAGGSKWGSSKVEKGGIRSFGKEVKEKTKKRLEAEGGVENLIRTAAAKQGTMTGASTSSSSSSRAGSSKGGGATSLAANPVGGKYNTKDVSLWGMLDVQDWLKATPPLEQYADVFEQNQINGSTLIDITLEDLDYMEIKVLMHRKLILKSAEELRKNSKGGAGGVAALPRPPSGQRKGVSAYEPVQVGYETKPQKAAPKVSHWSDLEPLAMNTVSGGTGTMVNGADEDDLGSGFFDEEAERKAFQDAVAEWRKAPADNSNNASSDNSRKKSSSSSSSSNSNSASAGGAALSGSGVAGDMLDEEAERRAFQAAVAEWRGGNGPAGKVVIEKDPKGSFTDSSAAHNSSSSSSSSSSSFLLGGGGAYGAAPTAGDAGMWKNPFAPPDADSGHKVGAGLLDDSDDDESGGGMKLVAKNVTGQQQQQHKKKSTGLPQETGPYAFKDGTLDEAAEHAEFVKAVETWRKQTSGEPAVDPAAMSSTASKSQAEKIAAALEAEQAAFSKRMQDQKREMEQKLKQSSEHLEKLKAMAAGAESPEKPSTNSRGAYTFSLAPHSVQASVASFAELSDTEKEEAKHRAEQQRYKQELAAATSATSGKGRGSQQKFSPLKSAAASFSGGVKARPLSASQRKGVDYTASASVSVGDYDDDGGDMILEEVDDAGPTHSVFIKEVETVTAAAVGSHGNDSDNDRLEESYVVEYDSD